MITYDLIRLIRIARLSKKLIKKTKKEEGQRGCIIDALNDPHDRS